jgi:hypothetical protein
MFFSRLGRVSALLLFSVIFISATSLSAQTYEKEVLIDGLAAPTGITVDLYGNLFYTEVPSPGEAGADNKVVRYKLRNGRKKVISVGEPYPTNLASDLSGNVYWSCQTAGVILQASRFGNGRITMAATGLDTPVGLDVPLLFRNTLLFTEVPTPGVNGANGGENQVNLMFQFFGRNFTFPLAEGEPEPVDVAVSLGGTAYWTCKTAGVILMQAPGGETTLVKSGIESPVGLDIDIYGRLYWTEVPTPGVNGDNGGRNRVVRYNPRNDETVVISEGEPEPVDVAVDLFGRSVYWTCKTAGEQIPPYLSRSL